ncbi:cytochrome P450 [Exidia glandulosa HHB12029]|uniref:Cytochrome P450 n=1 Tax=Exidia glandulosa HHB12029 TaxID=1314781 RepID=A0A165NSF5_EXIGL|nr:cytochrome P450 [Exidia glandulosa HHB12029]
MDWKLTDVFAVAFICAVTISLLRQKSRRLPPGPWHVPLIGNIVQFPGEPLAKGFAQLAKEYGPIFRLQVFGKRIVFVSSPKIASDLLDKRMSIYSDRPDWPMADLIGLEHAVLFQRYDDRYRRYRKSLHQALNAKTIVDYYDLQEREALTYLIRLLDTPEQFIAHTEYISAAVVFEITYGFSLSKVTERYQTLSLQMAEIKPGYQAWSLGGGSLSMARLHTWMAPGAASKLVFDRDGRYHIEARRCSGYSM